MNDLELAKRSLMENQLAFALAKNGVILKTGKRDGIGELIETVDSLGDQSIDASLADKIVGKAVAMVARKAGIRAVYSPLASIAARDALAQEHISLECDELVPLILNKRNDGPCPMERLTMPIAEPDTAVTALRDWLASRASRVPRP